MLNDLYIDQFGGLAPKTDITFNKLTIFTGQRNHVISELFKDFVDEFYRTTSYSTIGIPTGKNTKDWGININHELYCSEVAKMIDNKDHLRLGKIGLDMDCYDSFDEQMTKLKIINQFHDCELFCDECVKLETFKNSKEFNTLLLEYPETHLGEVGQMNFGYFLGNFIASQENMQIILLTDNIHLLHGIQMSIKDKIRGKEGLSKELVQINHLELNESEEYFNVIPLEINRDGFILKGDAKNFFGSYNKSLDYLLYNKKNHEAINGE